MREEIKKQLAMLLDVVCGTIEDLRPGDVYRFFDEARESKVSLDDAFCWLTRQDGGVKASEDAPYLRLRQAIHRDYLEGKISREPESILTCQSCAACQTVVGGSCPAGCRETWEECAAEYNQPDFPNCIVCAMFRPREEETA